MHSLWFVQWDFARRDHPGNPGRVSGSGPVNINLFLYEIMHHSKMIMITCVMK